MEAVAEDLSKLTALAAAADSSAIQSPQAAGAPERGWAKLPRESEMNWFARVQSHLDGSARVSRPTYHNRWKHEFSEEDKHRFKQQMFQRQNPNLPAPSLIAEPKPSAPEGPSLETDSDGLRIDETYTAEDLLREYKEISATHDMRLQHDQQRWELYGKFLLLLRCGKVKKNALDGGNLSVLHMSRKKLKEVETYVGSGAVPAGCPPPFRTGRCPAVKMTEHERRDLLKYIEYMAKTGQGLSVQQCQQLCFSLAFVSGIFPQNIHRILFDLCLLNQPSNQARQAITVLQMDKQGIFERGLSAEEAFARVEEMGHIYDVSGAWRAFRDWVEATSPKTSWLVVRNLRSRTLPEHSSCTPAVVSQAISRLEDLLVEIGVMDESKTIIPTEAHRLVCTDEKGFSQRADSTYRAVVPRGGKAAGQKPETSWEHITVCSFLPLAGSPFPVGIVTPTKRVHPDFSVACPSAVFWGNEGGSNTSESFAYFVQECFGKVSREQRKIPQDKALCLVLDSGGGSLLHLSVPLVQVCLKANIRLFFLPSYTTRCLMALDQNSHQSMADSWKKFKQHWSAKNEKLSLLCALRAIDSFLPTSLSEKMAEISWGRIGVVSGEPWDRNILFVERASEIFSTVRTEEAKKASNTALAILQKVSPSKSKCKGAGCGQMLGSNMKLCYNCGKANPGYSEEDYKVHRSGWRSGWKDNPAFEPPEVSEKEKELLNQVDDLTLALRKRKNKSELTETSGGQGEAPGQPPAKQIKVDEKAAAVPFQDPQTLATAENEEIDVGTEEGCVKFIVSSFNESERATILPLAEHYVATLKSKVCKGNPLWSVFNKEVIKPGKLSSTAGRKAWLAAEKYNRELRFVKAPKSGKK